MTTRELKPLPASASKQDIYFKIWKKQSTTYVRKTINTILKEHNISVFIQIIPPKQFKELVDRLGVPEGYFDTNAKD